MRTHPVIAIDGPSGAGKSTVARGLARALNYQFVDTGALYRTVARIADDAGISWDDGPSLAREALDHLFAFDSDGNLSLDGAPVGDTIRTSRMSKGASAVSRHAEVRAALLDIQRVVGVDGGVVLEGRDIGTVVFPDAEIKFFLIASVAERAKRRYLELIAKGESVTLADVESAQEARDRADREREISPLRKADDAVEVNCDSLDAAAVIARMEAIIRREFPRTPSESL